MEKAHQDIPWVPHAEIAPEPCGPGVQRRVLAYSKDAMCVENTFETGGVGAMHCHPTPRSPISSPGGIALPSGTRPGR